jgi:hypothetical protein
VRYFLLVLFEFRARDYGLKNELLFAVFLVVLLISPVACSDKVTITETNLVTQT